MAGVSAFSVIHVTFRRSGVFPLCGGHRRRAAVAAPSSESTARLPTATPGSPAPHRARPTGGLYMGPRPQGD